MTLTRITSDGITDSTIATADLADQSVTLAKLPHGTSSNDGKFLRANNGADPTFESVVTDLVNDSSPQLGGDLASNGNDILMADSDRIKLGTGNDLIIDHNGSDSFVKHVNTSGHMRVAGDSLKLMSNAGDENYLVATKDGAVELYHDNTKRLETTSNGVSIPQILQMGTSGSYIDLPDNASLYCGTGDDLRIYHDGSDSFIQNSTGQLILRTASVESAIVCVPNGAVNLYFDNSKKLETTSTGIQMEGSINVRDNHKVQLGNNQDLQIYHNGTDGYIENSTGYLYVDSGTSAIRFISDSSWANGKMAAFYRNGGVELYHNNVKKLETGADRVNISGHLFVNSGNRVYIQNGFNDSVGSINNTGGSNDSNLNFYVRNAGTESTALKIQKTGNVEIPVDKGLYIGASQDMQLYHNGTDSYILNATGNLRIGQYNNASLKFFTNNSTRWNIDGSGHFLPDANNSFDIGTSSYRVRNIYTNDLHLSNEGSSNDVDGTYGSFTIQEGHHDLFLINKRTGKKYKFNLTEVS